MSAFAKFAALCWLAVAGLSAAIGLGWASWSTAETVPLCAFRFWTGLRCPGCGMIHAWVEAFRGHWLASWHHNPLGLPFLGLWTLYLAWGLVSGGRFQSPKLSRAGGVAILLLVLAVHAARSL
ncbi:MAG: DUF2752 domain-containing protein [Elusimicrobia bacterium]|nr:DUF2752 domain-containing protein [Elusimicrobiota bacterium]